MTDTLARTAAFWNGTAERYAADPVSDLAGYERTLDRARHWLRPDMAVLEIGCGTGSTAIALSDAAGSILATDLSAEMLRIAREKARAAGAANLDFVEAGAARAGAGARFDAVLAFSILHLVEDLPGVLTHLRDRLEPGGLLISKTPCLSSRPWFAPLIALMQLLGKAPPHVGRLSVARLGTAIEAAGFEIVERDTQPGAVPRGFVVARAI